MACTLGEDGERISSYFDDRVGQVGFVNFTLGTQNVIRDFIPYTVTTKDTLLSFAAACVRAGSPKAFNYLLERHQKIEAINYTCTQDKFVIIDGNSSKSDFSILKNKIVLIGAIDSGFNYEDKHFTPLNGKLVGKGLPDMSGVVIHANIIRMMLNNNYINHTNAFTNWLIAFVLCWLHMAFFILVWLKEDIWFHVQVKGLQLISAVLIIYGGLLIFYHFNLQINLTDTIIVIILGVDVLYIYEPIAKWAHRDKRLRYKTLFDHER